jgi:hypothetical protein
VIWASCRYAKLTACRKESFRSSTGGSAAHAELVRRIAALLVLQERLDEACAAVTAGALSSENLGLA